ncbi:MAG: DegQ family serine endoprotease [Nitratireductor sp.]|nr:DegQ family serine endoprotease [Nitratireductor sp.]
MKRWPVFALALIGLLFIIHQTGTPASAQNAQTQNAQAQNALEDVFKKTLDDLLGGGKKRGNGQDRVERVPGSKTEIDLTFAPLVREAAPSVVNVFTAKVVQARRSPFEGDPFFERFFGKNSPFSAPQQRRKMQNSLGSGVIISEDGFVLTNNHVISDADEVKIVLSDGSEYEAEIMLKDEKSDLAVLKIAEEGQFEPIRIADSDNVAVGDLVLAIGNPFGVGQTVTSGIVSAVARSRVGITDFDFFIQTDAAINPGNSGGALIDMNGRLVGINTAIFSRSGGSNGIGFAIPSIMVKAVVNAARNGGDYFERPFFGATLDRVTPQIAEALGMERPSGVLVVDVTADAPAAKGGLKAGDVLLRMNGREIQHPDALGYRLATQSIGSDVRFDVLRNGKEVAVDVTLARAPDNPKGGKPVTIEGNSPFAGSRVEELTPRLAQRLRLPENTKGVVISDLAPGSPAEQFGFRAGDIVLELNGNRIASAQQLNEIANERSRWWRFTVERDGRQLRQVLRY